MKKGSNPIVGSWDDENRDGINDELHGTAPAYDDLDDTPFDPFSSGPIH